MKITIKAPKTVTVYEDKEISINSDHHNFCGDDCEGIWNSAIMSTWRGCKIFNSTIRYNKKLKLHRRCNYCIYNGNDES